jgi:hypothetical protein
MLHALSRLSHPLAAFLVLRSIPALIREQHSDGLWSDGARRRPSDSPAATHGANSPDEVATLRILTALDRFGFLNLLLPRPRR